MGSGRPGTRKSGNTDRKHLQMGRGGGVGARRSLETCRLKNAGGVGLKRRAEEHWVGRGWGFVVGRTERYHGAAYHNPPFHHVRLFIPFNVLNILVIKCQI